MKVPLPTVTFFALFLAMVTMDQITKWYVFEGILRVQGQPMNFLPWMGHFQDIETTVASTFDFGILPVLPMFNLVAVWNTGVSFGLFNQGGTLLPVIFTAFAFIMALIMLIWGARTTSRIEQICALFIAAGALGNALDRLRFKAVVDFIDIHFMGYHWPAFNLADSFIVLGALLLIVYILSSNPKGQE